MNNILTKLFIFTVGASIGSVVTWKIMDKKCKNRIEEAVEAVNQSCERVYGNMKKFTEVVAQKEDELKKKAYESIIAKSKYDKERKKEEDEPRKEEGEVQKFLPPYMIDPDDFATTGYYTVCLTRYEDGVIVDDSDDSIVENADELLGADNVEEMSIYADEVIYIRNDDKMTDYEICQDLREYYGDIVDEELEE